MHAFICCAPFKRHQSSNKIENPQQHCITSTSTSITTTTLLGGVGASLLERGFYVCVYICRSRLLLHARVYWFRLSLSLHVRVYCVRLLFIAILAFIFPYDRYRKVSCVLALVIASGFCYCLSLSLLPHARVYFLLI